MGCWGRNRGRLLCMLLLTFLFMVLEVVVSRLTASLAMLSDSFHMLSDVLALVVALVAERFARRTHATQKNTFGWIRAEVMGALVNAIFLTGLCFAILLEAVERFIEPHEMQRPLVVLGVGVAGLVVNVLGLCLFHHHSGLGREHSHGGHSYGVSKAARGGSSSPGPRGSAIEPAVGPDPEETNILVPNSNSANGLKQDRADSAKSRSEAADLQVNGSLMADAEDLGESDGDDHSAQLNMRGVFLHVFGDALGSVIVVVNALMFYLFWKACPEGEVCLNPCGPDPCQTLMDKMNITQENLSSIGPCWVLYLDPSFCIIMVCILFYTTYPLLKESALILLQTVPKQIDIKNLLKELRAVHGVDEVHELHVWQLAGSRIIATAHIKCEDPASYMHMAKTLKDVFHDHGIHATTIQPEFASVGQASLGPCELACRTQCARKQCCGAQPQNLAGKDAAADKPPAVSISCLELSESLEKKPQRTKAENMPAVVIEIKNVPNKQPESSL